MMHSQISVDPVEETPPPAAETTDPQYEQLAWAVGKMIQQQETLTAIHAIQMKQ